MTLKRIPLFGVCLVFCWAGLCAGAEPNLRPFDYHEGFEGVSRKVELWASNGDADVHFLGLTEEQAFEGRHSLKLDVTLKSGEYHYWGVPLRVPCVGRLRISARVFVAPGNTAQVGFGDNYQYLPSAYSGCGPYETYTTPTGEWKMVTRDLVASARASAESTLTRITATIKADHVVPTLDRWAIFVYGDPGQRAVVYIDDIRIQGEVPDQAALEALTKERWEKGHEALVVSGSCLS